MYTQMIAFFLLVSGFLQTASAESGAPEVNLVVKAAGDPWIHQAYVEMYRRQPTAWELNIYNYNNGSWSNYNELKQYIRDYHASLSKAGLSINTKDISGGQTLVGFNLTGKQVALDLVSTSDGKVIAAGGANVVAAGGANVVAAGGANLQVNANMAGVFTGNRYTVQSAGTTVVPTSGKGALIIK